MHRLVTDRNDLDPDLCDDLLPIERSQLEPFLRNDYVSRFLWLGQVDLQCVPALQAILNATAKRLRSPAYLFFDHDHGQPYLLALDRLAVLQGWRAELDSDKPFDRLVAIGTRGQRYPRAASLLEHADFAPFLSQSLAYFRNLGHPGLLPDRPPGDLRLERDLWYYLCDREPAVPQLQPPTETARTLLVAMPYLTYGGADFAIRILLEEGRLRQRFDRIFIVAFEEDENAAHHHFEPWVDAIHHLSGLGLDDEQKKNFALDFIRTTQVSDFFIANSRHGYDLIPRIRQANLPVRISAQIHNMEWDEATGLPIEAYFRTAAQHAVLIDRLTTTSDEDLAFMADHLYFPRPKIRAIKLGVDQALFHHAVGEPDRPTKQVLWCGRLCSQKDPLLGLRVAERFLRDRPDVKFLFVGDGPYRTEFANRLQAIQDAGNPIEWLAATDEMPRVLRASDCLLMTSVYEGIPVTAIEAASTGLPIIMSFKHNSVGEVLEHGRFFEIANRQDLEEYCRQLHEALAAPPATPSPFFSHHRYAREISDWLFSDRQSAPAGLDAVFGINHAA